MSDDWKERACNILKTYYLSFGGIQWHSFDVNNNSELLKVKICYALFGPPTNENATTIEDAYDEKQKSGAQEILQNILKVKRDDDSSTISIGFAFVVCHEEGKKEEYCVPVFSVLTEVQSCTDKRSFVDTQGRIYKDWNDWKETNCLPKVQIAYPKHGFFTCNEDGSYGFDGQKDPVIEFGESPQCSAWATTKTVGDIVSAVTSFGCAGVGIVSMFTPLAPIALTASAIVGGVSASYGAVRGVGALIDKGTHGQSLNDLESLVLWFSIVATPFHFASSAVSGVLAKGAVQQGRVFSQSMRVFASVLLCTTFGLDTALVSLSLLNLIKKAKDNTLGTLDVVQFSISVFFFTNTVMQPKTASGVIQKAQQMHFDNVAKNMSDETAKKTFDKFLENNKVDGSITDRSKIVRTINKMDDPSSFFKKVGSDMSADSIKIGGRKGRTVIINDQHGYGQRVKPNEYQVINTQVVPPGAGPSAPAPRKIKKVTKLVRNCFGEDPSDVVINGEKIFDGLDNTQLNSVDSKLGGTARNNKSIIDAAKAVAGVMGSKGLDEFLSIVEVVAKEVEGKSGAAMDDILKNLSKGPFIDGLRKDLVNADAIARSGGLTFKDSYKAVYHYRKHGEEFPSIIKKYGNSLEVYLGPTKNHIIDRSNLRQIVKLDNGDMKYTYVTKNNEFGIVISNPDGRSICTMYNNPGSSAKFPAQVVPFAAEATVSPITQQTISELERQAASLLGLRAFQVNITADGIKQSISDCSSNISEEVRSLIAELLKDFNNNL